jgi:hypothetical protein
MRHIRYNNSSLTLLKQIAIEKRTRSNDWRQLGRFHLGIEKLTTIEMLYLK